MSVTEHPQRWSPGEVREHLPSAPDRRPASCPRVSAASSRPSRARALAELAVGRGRVGRARWWVQLLVIAWLVWIYDLITDLAPLREQAAMGHGLGLLHLEQVLHLDPELALNRWLSAHHTLGVLVSDYYDNAHFAVTLGLLGWLWWRRSDIYRPLRTSLVLINVIGFAVFWRYPVAPPRLLTGSGFIDTVADSHAFGSFHSGSLATDANQLAAMPSLHMAWAAWSGLAIWRLRRGRLGAALGFGYPVLTALAVMATGNHYLVDVVAGILTMVLAGATVHIVGRRRGGLSSGPGAGGPNRLALPRMSRLRPRAVQGAGAPAPAAGAAK
jgi:hypothetical protein